MSTPQITSGGGFLSLFHRRSGGNSSFISDHTASTADQSLPPAAAPHPAIASAAPPTLAISASGADQTATAEADLTSMVRLILQAEVKQMISEALIEIANHILLPTSSEGQLVANLPSAGQLGPAQRHVELQVSRIKDLEVQLKESEQKQLRLQQELEMLKPIVLSAGPSSPSLPMLQEAHTVMYSALEACARKVNEQVKSAVPGIRSRRSTFIQQLCRCFFSEFDTASFGVTAKVDAPQVSTFQRPDRDQKLHLFREYQQYSAENASTLFDHHTEGRFRSFCSSKFQILLDNDKDSTPFTNPNQRSYVLSSLLQLHSCPLFVDFIELGKTVWLLHKLAFAFDPIAEIFSVNEGESYNPQNMEVLDGITGNLKTYRGAEPITGFVTVPGFIVQNYIIKAQLLHFKGN